MNITDQPTSLPADDHFHDPCIATVVFNCIIKKRDGQLTNSAEILVRPLYKTPDESGDHPGEMFIQITITREEVRALLHELDRDWKETVSAIGDPNLRLNNAPF